MRPRSPLLAALTVGVLLQGGCAGTIVRLDRPAYHHQNGMRLLREGNFAAARLEFEYVLSLDEAYADAHVGLAVSSAALGDREAAQRALRRAAEIYSGAAGEQRTDTNGGN